MFAIGIELLSGRYVATAYNDRDRAEWPPHPARLFSALVATWAETSPRSETGEPIDGAGARALDWLAEQPAPRILASASGDVAHRSVVTVFVPVNDVAVVSGPDREKLDAALAAEASDDGKARERAAREARKLESKLLELTAKAIARPAKFGKGDAAAGAAVLPESRTRQPRTFPSATPPRPLVGFVWPSAEPAGDTVAALNELLGRLSRLGHSSSFVSARLLRAEEVTKMGTELTAYREDPDTGEHIIRWVGAQQRRALRGAFELHRETEPRVLPSVFMAYSEGEPQLARTPSESVFDPHFVVLARVGGPRLPITAVPGVSRQLRRALMAALGADIPELLSGHRPDGSPSEQPHVAIVPLPVVGGPHADGALIGVALVFPRDADPSARRRVLAALTILGRENPSDESAAIRLQLGSAGTLDLQVSEWGEDTRATLRSSRWTRPSRTWVTTTPIALDRNPGDLHAVLQTTRAAAFAEAEASVAMAAERIGLPRPAAVEVSRSCVLSGSAKPRAYGKFPGGSKKPERVLVHARLAFDHHVRGPLLLGAGRYQGMGLCLPIDGDRETSP